MGESKSISTESLVNFAELVSKNNYLNKDTAIGTKFAPPYAMLFMGDFEERVLDWYNLKPWVWWKFIDDVFLV